MLVIQRLPRLRSRRRQRSTAESTSSKAGPLLMVGRSCRLRYTAYGEVHVQFVEGLDLLLLCESYVRAAHL